MISQNMNAVVAGSQLPPPSPPPIPLLPLHSPFSPSTLYLIISGVLLLGITKCRVDILIARNDQVVRVLDKQLKDQETQLLDLGGEGRERERERGKEGEEGREGDISMGFNV